MEAQNIDTAPRSLPARSMLQPIITAGRYASIGADDWLQGYNMAPYLEALPPPQQTPHVQWNHSTASTSISQTPPPVPTQPAQAAADSSSGTSSAQSPRDASLTNQGNTVAAAIPTTSDHDNGNPAATCVPLVNSALNDATISEGNTSKDSATTETTLQLGQEQERKNAAPKKKVNRRHDLVPYIRRHSQMVGRRTVPWRTSLILSVEKFSADNVLLPILRVSR